MRGSAASAPGECARASMDDGAELPSVGRCCSPDLYTPKAEADGWLFSPFTKAMRAVKSSLVTFHETTGAPWWATIALCGASLRLACMPLAVQAMSVGHNYTRGQQDARRHIVRLLGDPSLDSLIPVITGHDARAKLLAPKLAPGNANRLWAAAPLAQARVKSSAEGHSFADERTVAGIDEYTAVICNSSSPPRRLQGTRSRHVKALFQLTKAHTCRAHSVLSSSEPHRPHTLRAVRACNSKLACVQIPLLITAAAAVSSLDHTGLTSGGLLWAPDLTASAIDVPQLGEFLRASHADTSFTDAEAAAMRQLVAPMGLSGCILPIALFLILRHNLSRTVRDGMSVTLKWLGVETGGRSDAVDRAVVRTSCFVERAAALGAELPIRCGSLCWRD